MEAAAKEFIGPALEDQVSEESAPVLDGTSDDPSLAASAPGQPGIPSIQVIRIMRFHSRFFLFYDHNPLNSVIHRRVRSKNNIVFSFLLER